MILHAVFVHLGLGAGLTHIPAKCIIGEYFTTSYTQANGLAHVGPGLGLVVYPPLLERLIYTFGWRGSFLIEGAIAFHIVAAACLFRPVKYVRKRDEVNHIELKRKYQSEGTGEGDGLGEGQTDRDERHTRGSSCITDSCKMSYEDDVGDVNCSSRTAKDNLHKCTNERCNLLQDFKKNTENHEDSGIQIANMGPYDRCDSIKASNNISAKENQRINNDLGNCAKESDDSTAVYFKGDSVRNSHDSSCHRCADEGLDAKSSLEDIVKSKDKHQTLPTQFRTGCSKYIPTVPILYTCVLSFLISIAWLAVLSHGVATAIETGVSKSQASLVLSVIGASSIVSRLTHGYCIDHGWISVLGTEVFMLVLATISTCVNLFIDGFVVLMVFATCSGFASGVFFTLLPVIIRQIDTKDRMAYNLGLVYAAGAAGDLCGGYFAGIVSLPYFP